MTTSDPSLVPRLSAAELTRTMRRIVDLMDRAVPGVLRAISLWALIEAVVTIATPVLTQRLVDSVDAARSGAPAAHAYAWLGAELTCALVRVVSVRAGGYGRQVLASRGTPWLTRAVLEKACNAAYERFETPGYVSRLGRARDDATMHAVEFATQGPKLGGAALIFAGCAVLLLTRAAWSLPVLLAATVPAFVCEALVARQSFQLENAHAHRRRQGWYLEWLLTAEHNAKELRALGAGHWLLRMYSGTHRAFREGQVVLARRGVLHGSVAQGFGLVTLYAPYLYVVVQAVKGDISVGGMLLFVVAFQHGAAALGQLMEALASAVSKEFHVRHLLDFLDEPDGDADAEPDDPILATAPELVLEDLWFTYPGASEPVLRGLTLRIRAGETLAIVGANGIGKTTLVKIILGLYPISRGRILLGGTDLATKSAAWRRRNIGVVFQDFVRFQFSISDNVGIGWVPQAHDDARIRRALQMADADAMVDALPDKERSTLGTAFGGSDISGGQWQRIALARLFMRESRLWILDEPTAAMDPETEERLFRRVHEWTVGRTALVISHRLSTVVMADRIAVIRDGQVAELGTHRELVMSGGPYAQLVAGHAAAIPAAPALPSP